MNATFEYPFYEKGTELNDPYERCAKLCEDFRNMTGAEIARQIRIRWVNTGDKR